MELHVTRLFRSYLSFSVHSFCIKLAEIAFLSKVKRDPSTVKRWRPISLLSYLGKRLKRILAKIMSQLVIFFDIVGRKKFGALAKRSATDFVSCVILDIEEAKLQG